MKEPRRGLDFSQELAEKGWYHSFELPDGTRIEGFNKIDWLRKRYARFPIPEDLTGKRVLDIGAWDGWFSFEAERHGAAVTAIDCVEVANFLAIQKTLASRVSYRIVDFYELPEAGLGVFDFVFFLGILYHLKHPLLALEIVCGLTTDTAIVESFVIDADTWQDHRDEVPTMEFYETDELGNQLDNWIGPSVSCLMAMCRAAGFARVEFLHTTGLHAGVACHRKWEAIPAEPKRPAPELLMAANSRTFGVNFSTRKEEYITCWFLTAEPNVTRGQLRLEVGDFGVPALYVRPDEGGAWLANFRLPPGLGSGWSPVRLRLADSAFGSTTLRIAVDLPLRVERLALTGVCDGLNWNAHEVKATAGGFISCWVTGLPENCDRTNIGVYLGETRLRVEFIGEPDTEGIRQINAALPAALPGDAGKGEQPCRVECAGVSSERWPLNVV
jgi:tRNA (mo5U34)-methyltransferase